ncbi:DUF2835 domain-containing protein [Halomonas mongoliensis]|uniref:DUF2835 domain-containing protein n=1 Tax=Halomonas mongoliensis TaxID=321265 RepID=UPI00403AE734
MSSVMPNWRRWRMGLNSGNDVATFDVVLNLSAETCLAYYEGRIEQVVAVSLDGRRVAFPAVALRRIMTRDGVRGVFRLEVSEQGRLLNIRQVAELPAR